MRSHRLVLCIAALISLAGGSSRAAEPAALNGFSLAGARIPVEEIRRGGPPRDGIPALDDPRTLPAKESPWSDDSRVIGVEVAGQARAYPIAVLTWHELVNDRLGGRPILVSFCPLCGTAMVFDRRVNGRELRFGVSGLLYRSDLLMFDRASDSLWSQISAEAVTGPQRGRRLTLLRARTTTWGAWRALHPTSTVLSRDTGHARDYAQSPYAGYEQSDRLYFPAPLDARYHPKTRVVGLRTADGQARAYALDEIAKTEGVLRDRFAGHDVRIEYDGTRASFRVDAPDEVEVIEGFWFAWMAFHPQSSVYRAP